MFNSENYIFYKTDIDDIYKYKLNVSPYTPYILTDVPLSVTVLVAILKIAACVRM